MEPWHRAAFGGCHRRAHSCRAAAASPLTLRALAPLPDAEGGVGGEGGEGVGGSGGVLPHKQSRERSGDELGGGEDRGVSRQRTDQ